MRSPRLDREVRAFLEEGEASGLPALETMPPAAARLAAVERMAAVRGNPEPVASVENLRIPGPDGEIPIRVYTPLAEGPRPGIVFFHGGGWVLGNLDTHHTVSTAMANRSGAVLVSVDYRLAPEHKFPAAVTDSYAALVWAAAHAAELGFDPQRLVVVGDSAGGNLAAVAALKSRDENGPPIALQVLVYPVTDLSALSTESYQEFAEQHSLTKSLMSWFRDHYLGSEEDGAHPHASPLLAPDLRGLPPALVITAECDPLRDEGEAYARRLLDAGVPVTLTRYAGMIHPFFTMPGRIAQADDAIQEVADAVRDASPAQQASRADSQ